MDLCRLILLNVESSEGGTGQPLVINGYDSKTISYHVYLLSDADFLNISKIAPTFEGHVLYVPNTLTWAGHEFLDAARDEKRWGQAKKISEQAGGVAIEVMKGLLQKLASQAVGLPQ